MGQWSEMMLGLMSDEMSGMQLGWQLDGSLDFQSGIPSDYCLGWRLGSL